MSRYGSRSEVDIDARFDDRRSSYGGRRGGDRFAEADLNFRTGSGALPTRERETVIFKEREEVDRRTPAFLREDYGQTTAGAMVLRARDREDITYAPPRRRRSSSPDTRKEREEIIIRRDERSESRPPAPRAMPREREPSLEREEIIIRRDERSQSKGPGSRYGGREGSREREEIIIRRDERDSYAPPRRATTAPPREVEREREEIIIRRDEKDTRSRFDDDLVSHRSYRPPAPPSRNDVEREEIIIRRDRKESEDRSYRPPPPPIRNDVEREEIIIRRDRQDSPDRSYRAPPPPTRNDIEREEIIIRRDRQDSPDRSYRAPPPPTRNDFEREEIIIRRDRQDSPDRSYRAPPPPSRADVDRQEIIIRREERDFDDRGSRISRKGKYDDDMSLFRPISRERARARSHSSASEEEIIIRRENRENRGRESTRQEIIIRKSSRSRSPSPTASVSTRAAPRPAPVPAPEPQVIYAPQIHQEVITHHRHIDHGYEVQLAPRREPVYARPPSPPSPPPPPPLAPASVRELSEERIEIRRSETRNGRTENEDIVISRNDRSRSRGPPPSRVREQEIDFREEIDYSSSRRPGYNGNRRSKFTFDSELDEGYTTDPGRPMPRGMREPEPEPEPRIAARYGNRRDPRDGLWTEVTKDLVLKEAIEEMGYEYQETEEHYYVFKYMQYADVAHLVGLSEDIRKNRYKRIKEIQWENRARPQPAIEPASPRAPLAIEAPPTRRDDRSWSREDERYIEREVVFRGGRPPPPPGWRR